MKSFKKNFTSVLAIVAISGGSLLIGISPASAAGGYYPKGPQLNVPISTITSAGWKLCWSSLYSATDTLANIESSCTGTYLLEAGGAVGASSYILAAAGERSSVLKPTGLNETNLNNGTYWYYNRSGFGSMGFSPNSTINQNSADCTYNGARNCSFDSVYVEGEDPTANLRLSWHLNATDIYGGWRLGHINWLNTDTFYIRAIYQSDDPMPKAVAEIDSIKFVDDGTGTGGNLVWTGRYIDAVMFIGDEKTYPGAFNYGAFTTHWNGRLNNLKPGTTYSASIHAVSIDGLGESKSVTFTTTATIPVDPSAKNATISKDEQSSIQLANLFRQIDLNTFFSYESENMKMLLTKFNALQTSDSRNFVKIPTSRVSQVTAKSLTAKSCSVAPNGTVRALSKELCQISYTIIGQSESPVTLIKDFYFTKVID